MQDCEKDSSYESLIRQICASAFSTRQLEDCKQLFCDQINSIRCTARIQSLKDLVCCLEGRDILSEFDIKPLRQISANLQDDDVCRAVEQHQEIARPKELENVYALQRRKVKRETKTQFSTQEPKYKPKVEQQPTNEDKGFEAKREAIYRVIAQNIGLGWRTFGRVLGVKISKLDSLEGDYPKDIQSRAYEILNIFENDPRYNPREHFYLICDALDKSKKPTLRQSVQKMMTF